MTAGPELPLQVLLETVVAVGSDLSLPVILNKVVEGATRLTGARYGALGVLAPAGGLGEFVTVGVTTQQRAAIGPEPQGLGLLGTLIHDPRPLRLRDLGAHADSFGFPPNHPPMRSFLGVPIRVRDAVFGNLYLCEKSGAEEFTAEDEELVVALSIAAGVAVENARLSDERERLRVVEERERIGRDLHDTVIQRLFATGMNLQGAAAAANDLDVGARLQRAVDEIDATIREIRTTIFALGARDMAGSGLRAEVLKVVEDAARQGGWRPRAQFDGPIDNVVRDDVGAEVLACLREALSNAVRHADAQRVDVTLAVADGQLRLTVADDGAGIPDREQRRSGLVNMARRAEALGGSFAVSSRAGSGTHLEWRVPV